MVQDTEGQEAEGRVAAPVDLVDVLAPPSGITLDFLSEEQWLDYGRQQYYELVDEFGEEEAQDRYPFWELLAEEDGSIPRNTTDWNDLLVVAVSSRSANSVLVGVKDSYTDQELETYLKKLGVPNP